jgi:hypothetical protein
MLMVVKDIQDVIMLNRYFRKTLLLREQLDHLRPFLVVAALTHSAAGSFPRIGILLSDHTDVLCELMTEMASPSVAGGGI